MTKLNDSISNRATYEGAYLYSGVAINEISHFGDQTADIDEGRSWDEAQFPVHWAPCERPKVVIDVTESFSLEEARNRARQLRMQWDPVIEYSAARQMAIGHKQLHRPGRPGPALRT